MRIVGKIIDKKAENRPVEPPKPKSAAKTTKKKKVTENG